MASSSVESSPQEALHALHALPEEEKFALAGLLGVLLGRSAAAWDLEPIAPPPRSARAGRPSAAEDAPAPFCAALLRSIVCALLGLDETQYHALAPLSSPASAEVNSVDPSAFAQLLQRAPADGGAAATDGAPLHALLALGAVGIGVPTSDGRVGYDARVRQLLADAADALGVPWQSLVRAEAELAASLASLQADAGEEADVGPSPGAKWKKRWKKRIAVAGIGVASGAAIALTAGLAAPAVVGGLAVVGSGVAGLGGAGVAVGGAVGGVATALSGAAGIAVVTSVFGAAGGGLAAFKMDKRTRDVRQFAFRQPPARLLAAARAAAARASESSTEASAGSSAAPDEECDDEGDGGGDVDAMVVAVCVPGWLVADDEAPTDHFWRVRGGARTGAAGGAVEDDEAQLEDEAAAAADAEAMVARAVAEAQAGAAPVAAKGEVAVAEEGAGPAAAPPAREPAADVRAPEAMAIVREASRGPSAADAAESATALSAMPWAEHHVLEWESDELRKLGYALSRLAATEALATSVATTAGMEALKHTFFSALLGAVMPSVYLAKLADAIDNPWSVAHARARKAGVLLATALLGRAHGARPVILVGYSLGAALVHECLHEMARQSEEGRARGAGVVHHAVLMGLPATSEPERWGRLRRVVSGRLINCYRPSDLVLRVVYRGAEGALGAAGLRAVACEGVENFDVSRHVRSHAEYRHAVGPLLQLVDLREA